MKGLFITFEGIEGCGKTTQLVKLSNYLGHQGFSVLEAREPGGTAIGDTIRAILLDPHHREMSALCELFLYEASRIQLLNQVIRPALAQGSVVLCDRFTDSSVAYQGYGRGLPVELIAELNRIATDGLNPQLTFLFDLSVEEGFQRIEKRHVSSANRDSGNKKDRLELEGLLFHQRVREGFLKLARSEPERIKMINAGQDEEEIFKSMLRIVEGYVISRDHRAGKSCK